MVLSDKAYPILDKDNTRPLTNIEKKELICTEKRIKEFTNYDRSIYHVKRKDMALLLNELIGEIISEYYDLTTIKSTVCIDKRTEVDGSCVLLSKLFTSSKEKYEYFRFLFSGICIDEIVGLDNLNRLQFFVDSVDGYKYTVKETDPVSLTKLLENLKKMIIRDFMTNLRDRNGANFLFRINDTKLDLMPVHDYEYSFGYGSTHPQYFGMLDMNLDLENVVEFIKSDSYFQYLLTKSMDMDIEKILKQCEEEHRIRIEGRERELCEYHIEKAKKKILENNLIK